jgi:fructokinase
VYFFDRVSPAALSLAKAYAKAGTLVVFEPSAVGEPRLFSAAMECAHVLKYSEERMRTLGAWIADSKRSPDLIVEIETLGAAGLRYRVGPAARRWFALNAYLVDDLRDTAGAGDWCTAGFLNALVRARASGGDVPRVEIRASLEVGQALAAWNCGFEGARGAMYATTARGAPVPIRTIIASARKSPARHSDACTGTSDIADSGEAATRL